MNAPFAYAEFCEELDIIFHELELRTDRRSLDNIGNLAVGVALRPPHGDKPVISVTLAAGLQVPTEVRRLAWGLVNTDGEIAATGRTTDLGQFQATVPAGRYRVRYVAEPASWLDRTILAQIGDYAARFDIRRYDRDRTLPTALPREWRVNLEQSPALGMALSTSEPHDLAPGVDVGISLDGRYFKVKLSDQVCGEADFPFGVVLIQHVTDEGRVLASRLSPMTHDVDEASDAGHWIAIERTEDLLPDREDSSRGELIAWVVTADRPELISAISRDELARYRNSPFVLANPRLLAGATQLQQLLTPGSRD
ncbi:MAG: hypothetical protein ACK5UC_05665 [Planctomycetaceae bacterium]